MTRRGVRDPNAEAAAALTFNVAGLLAEPAGVSRSYDIDPVTLDPGEGLRLSSPVSGRVRVAG